MTGADAPLYLVAFLVLGILVGILLGVLAAVRRVAPGARRLGHAIDDILGEPERPGVKARPGLVERMARVDEVLGQVPGRFDVIESALSKLANATTGRLDEHGRRLDEHGRRLDEHERRLSTLTERIERHHPSPADASTPAGPPP